MKHLLGQWRKPAQLCLLVSSIIILLTALLAILDSVNTAEARSHKVIFQEIESQVQQTAAYQWMTETVDKDGTWVPAMVLDQYQKPHLAYGCEKGACYAVTSGTQWITQTISSYGIAESIALDTPGNPHVCLSVNWGGSNPRSVLYYAYSVGSSWFIQTVDEYVGNNKGLGRNASLALDAAGHPHIVYYGPHPNAWPLETDYRHAYHNGAKWITETIAYGAYGNGAGFASGLIMGADSRMHTLFSSFGKGYSIGDIRYAYFDGNTWYTQTIAVGIGGALAMAPDGSLHASFITYPSNTDDWYHLKYASLIGSEWVIEDVTRLVTETVLAPLSVAGYVFPGATALQIDSYGRPLIAFFNTTDGYTGGYLRYAYRNGSEWTIETIDTQDGAGWGRLSLALESIHPRIAYYALGNDQEVRYAQKTATPPPSVTINFTSGAPGSFFALSGANFPLNGIATVTVNGHVLTDTLTVDSAGSFAFQLETSQANAGRYFVTVSVNPRVTVDFMLDVSAPLRTQQGSAPILTVPSGIAFTQFVYLPLVRR